VIENIPQLNNKDLPEQYTKTLSRYFKKVRFISTKPLFKAYGEIVKGFLIFEVEGHTGQLPEETDLY